MCEEGCCKGGGKGEKEEGTVREIEGEREGNHLRIQERLEWKEIYMEGKKENGKKTKRTKEEENSGSQST